MTNLKVKIHNKVGGKYGEHPVTAKFRSFNIFSLWMSFAKDGMQAYLDNMTCRSGGMFDSTSKSLAAIKEMEEEFEKDGIELEGQLKSFEFDI